MIKIKNMELVGNYYILMMELNIKFQKDSLKIINWMDLEELYGLTVIMKENGKIIYAMGKVNKSL